jgi:hypothetical protein
MSGNMVKGDPACGRRDGGLVQEQGVRRFRSSMLVEPRSLRDFVELVVPNCSAAVCGRLSTEARPARQHGLFGRRIRS